MILWVAAALGGDWPLTMNLKKGISASPGVAIGSALVVDTEEYRIPRRTVAPAEIPAQLRTLAAALEASKQEVAELSAAVARKHGEKTAEILAFHGAFIAEAQLRTRVVELIEKHGYSAAYAFSRVMNDWQKQFLAVADPYLRSRVIDLYDIEKRVLRHILGRAREDITRLTEPVIVVAHDITPSQAVSLDRRHILGMVLNAGGAASHTAIIARMIGIPTVVGLNDVTSEVSGGELLVVDGTHGIVVLSPDDETVERYRQQQQQDAVYEQSLVELRDLPAVTRDRVRINLLANIELANEARAAMDTGAEGIGLYRTEFIYLASDALPGEDQQYEILRAAVRHARNAPLTIRTMDLGAEKMARFMQTTHDPNPVLGLRSLRYCLQHLDLFRTHLRAILRAAVDGNVKIMFPMITTLMELRQAKATLNDVIEDLQEEGLPTPSRPVIGMMVETPAAAMQAIAFSREVAFFSIGTNDLTQYTLAVDRANERVAHLYAAHNPAVLRLVRDVVLAAKKAEIEVNVCGEMAGIPLYTELLLGLGLRQLSMAPKEIPAIKRIIRRTNLRRCEAIARKVLRFDADRQIHNYLRDKLREIDEDGEA